MNKKEFKRKKRETYKRIIKKCIYELYCTYNYKRKEVFK